jgi:hypothetical protein
MQQAIEVHRSGALRGAPADEHLRGLWAIAKRQNLQELQSALKQRYPGQVLA